MKTTSGLRAILRQGFAPILDTTGAPTLVGAYPPEANRPLKISES